MGDPGGGEHEGLTAEPSGPTERAIESGTGAATDSDPQPAGTVSWRELLAETAGRLGESGIDAADQEARWIVEVVTGHSGAELVLALDEPATERGVAHLDALVARRRGGEPIQHVLGSWGFRTLDLLCDRRALIPRPETELVVSHALDELDAVLMSRPAGHRAVVVDLGTGTGAIALSVAVERPGTEVWGLDRSTEALALARANLAGLGMAGRQVRLAEGDWFEGLPGELAGAVDLVVTNPPYVAADETLPAAVLDWEPHEALVPGPTGLEAYEVILAGLDHWLAPGGAFVAELGAGQGVAVSGLAQAAGLDMVRVEPDHAGHDRTLIARRPS